MQDTLVVENDWMRTLRRRRAEEGKIFWSDNGPLTVLDAQAAQSLEAANYAELTLLDGFSDVVRGRTSEEVTWNQVRSGWNAQLRNLAGSQGLRQLAQRMDELIGAQVGRQQDLVWLAERAITEPLVPTIIAGLKPVALRRLIREIRAKVAWVLSDIDPHRISPLHKLKMAACQVVAGVEVRRELKGRADGNRPRQQDLADPVVEIIAKLGIDRAVDAVTALLTAICGSPGAAAACLFFELHRQHDWRTRLEAELGALTLEQLCESPLRQAPLTARFIKEILRIWSSPPIVVRAVRTQISYEQYSLKPGQHYVLSNFLIHHDQTEWANPEVFDPDRWLTESRRGQCPHGSYVPFGWSPKSCIGASLGMAQLVILTHMMCTRFQLRVPDPERARMHVASVVRPKDFHGSVVRR